MWNTTDASAADPTPRQVAWLSAASVAAMVGVVGALVEAGVAMPARAYEARGRREAPC